MMERVPLMKAGENYLLKASSGRTVRLIETIGEGGTYLAYKAVEEINGVPQKVCVILEWNPVCDEEAFSMIQYKREESGEELRIMLRSPYDEILSEEEKEKIYQEELQHQEENALREVQNAKELFYDEEKQENSPYLYHIEYFTRRGDTYYLKIDTSEGCTLHRHIKEHAQGHLSFQEGLEIIKKLLEILSSLSERGYIHGDIKPQNIWLSGQGAAMSQKLLDMGSAFKRQEYDCQDFETWSEAEIIQKADYIIKNRGIGCSTKGYCNSNMNQFFDAKAAYYGARELAAINPIKMNIKNQYKAAVRLLETMKQVDVSADLYSSVETLFYCVAGKNYSGETEAELQQLLKEPRAVCERFANIIKKNRKEGYTSIEALKKDLNKLERILNREADPEVLLEAIRDTLPDIQHIDPSIFGKIK